MVRLPESLAKIEAAYAATTSVADFLAALGPQGQQSSNAHLGGASSTAMGAAGFQAAQVYPGLGQMTMVCQLMTMIFLMRNSVPKPGC